MKELFYQLRKERLKEILDIRLLLLFATLISLGIYSVLQSQYYGIILIIASLLLIAIPIYQVREYAKIILEIEIQYQTSPTSAMQLCEQKKSFFQAQINLIEQESKGLVGPHSDSNTALSKINRINRDIADLDRLIIALKNDIEYQNTWGFRCK